MEVTIKVDSNSAEADFAQAIRHHTTQLNASNKYTCTHERNTLYLGDALVQCNGHNYIFERKEWDDWCASIRDGRYKEQKARFLASSTGDDHFFYIIVNREPLDIYARTNGMQNQNALSAVLKTNLRDHIPTLQAYTTDHAGWTVAYIAHQLATGGLKTKQRETESGIIVGMDRSKMQQRKRANLDGSRSNMMSAMLCGIVGMSDEKARCIASHYSCLQDLCHASKEDIADITCGAKKRRIGPKLATVVLSICNK